MKHLYSINWHIVLTSSLLISIGILVIYSSSKELAFQQLLYTVIGWLFFFLLLQLDLHSLKKLVMPLYILAILLLITVAVLGVETRGSVRWIPVGFFNIQPSEFAKVVSVLFLASFWSKNTTNWINILKSVIWIFPFIFLIFNQPDLGSALALVAIWIGMLFSGLISIKKMIILALTAFLIIPLTWVILQDYQKQRIIGFFNPSSDPLGRNYNLIQSTIAVGSGQLFGRGLGRGTQSRLQFLPEFRTDFIFASIAEELGFVGCLIILSVYLYLLTFCLKIGSQAKDKFSFLVVAGVFFLLLFQIFVNIGMNIGILPITGITLPLISYGGSSLIVTFISLGLVSLVAKSNKRV